MQEFLSYFIFDDIEIIGLIVLGLSLIISLFFCYAYYNKPYRYAKKQSELDKESKLQMSDRMVSVIIESENEAYHLSKNLIHILEQNYPNFEVVVVNKGSTDESYEVLEDLSVKYKNIYHTYIPITKDNRLSTRQLALTVGLKAAKGDIVLFTEAYSRPISPNWISEMVANLTDEQPIILGYSYYEANQPFFGKIAHFDNLMHSMQYLSMALKTKAYTGVYRNIVFKKSLFFDNKGFARSLGLVGGEDVFIHNILRNNKAGVALSKDSFVETAIERFVLWKQLKKTYSAARSVFKGTRGRLFRLEYLNRYVFWILSLGLVGWSVYYHHWGLLAISVLVLVMRFVVLALSYFKVSNYFSSKKFLFSFPFIELLQPIYNFRFKSKQEKYMR